MKSHVLSEKYRMNKMPHLWHTNTTYMREKKKSNLYGKVVEAWKSGNGTREISEWTKWFFSLPQ